MKILLIDNFFYRRGGAEVVFLNTGELLTKHGHEVIYFSQRWKKNTSSQYSVYFPEGNDFSSRSFRQRIWGLISYFYNFRAAKKLRQLLIRYKPDIAHIHLFWGGLSPSILKVLKEFNVPIVHTVHDYRMVCPAYTFKDGKNRVCEQCKGRRFYQCFRNKCSKGNRLQSCMMAFEMYIREQFFSPLRYIDYFVFVSQFSLKKHIEHYPGFQFVKKSVLYNFHDAKGAIDKLDNYDCYYLYYGRLSSEKGLHTLIQAIGILKDVRLKIVGVGPLEEELISICRLHNYENIEFMGFKSGQELFSLVANAKFVCLPAEWYENNPMTIIESYFQGVPVIASRIGGITEIVDDGVTGFLHDPSNIDSLVDVLRKSVNLSGDEYAAMSRSAYSFALSRFESEKHYQALMSIYESLILQN